MGQGNLRGAERRACPRRPARHGGPAAPLYTARQAPRITAESPKGDPLRLSIEQLFRLVRHGVRKATASPCRSGSRPTKSHDALATTTSFRGADLEGNQPYGSQSRQVVKAALGADVLLDLDA